MYRVNCPKCGKEIDHLVFLHLVCKEEDVSWGDEGDIEIIIVEEEPIDVINDVWVCPECDRTLACNLEEAEKLMKGGRSRWI